MRPGAATREPDYGAPGIRIPVRRSEPHECRDEVDIVVGVEALGEILGLGGALYDSQAVPEPLNRRPGYEDGAFQRVLDRLVAQAPGDGSQELVLALYGFGAGVHEGEGARTVSVLGESLLKGDLAEKGGLLVSGDPSDRDLSPEDLCVCVPVNVRTRLDLR